MRAAAAAVALVLAAGSMNPTPAMAQTPLRWGYGAALITQADDAGCTSTARIWFQELGLSDVVRLRVRFELRAPYDPGIPGTSYATRGWFYSGKFPNDARSHWAPFAAAFRHEFMHSYKIRVIMVGERASFWRPDRKLKVDLEPYIECTPVIDMGA